MPNTRIIDAYKKDLPAHSPAQQQPQQHRNPSPRQAIRRFCLDCEGGCRDAGEAVQNCLDTACPFHAYRTGVAANDPKRRPPLVKVIKKYCHDYCQAGAGRREVELCAGDSPAVPGAVPPCPVYPFRLGKNPNITEATRQQRRCRGKARAEAGALNFR